MPKGVLVGLFFGLCALLVLDGIVARAGFAPGLAESLGPSVWATSRAAGVTAFLAIALDVAFGLFISTGAVDAWIARPRVVEVHRWLSGAALALVAVHAFALSADRFVRFDAFVVIGAVAALAMAILHASFDFISRIGGYAWRKLHYASFFVFAAAIAHGVFSGSDSARPGLRALYLGSLGVVVALASYRGARVIARRRAPATPSAGRRAST